MAFSKRCPRGTTREGRQYYALMAKVVVETDSTESARTVDPTNASALPSWSELGNLEWSWETCIAHELHELQFLIVCHSAKKVLVKHEECRWVLPGCCYPFRELPSVFKPPVVIPEVQKLVGCTIPLSFVRQAWRGTRPVPTSKFFENYEKYVMLMACDEEFTSEHGVNLSKHGYMWMPVGEVRVSHLIEEAAVSIETELRYVENGTQPEHRVTWQRLGWLRTATSWMMKQLRLKHDAVMREEVIHLRSSYIGAIIQAETTAGRFF